MSNHITKVEHSGTRGDSPARASRASQHESHGSHGQVVTHADPIYRTIETTGGFRQISCQQAVTNVQNSQKTMVLVSVPPQKWMIQIQPPKTEAKALHYCQKTFVQRNRNTGSTTELQTETRPQKTQLASDKYQVFLDTFDVKCCGHISLA